MNYPFSSKHRLWYLQIFNVKMENYKKLLSIRLENMRSCGLRSARKSLINLEHIFRKILICVPGLKLMSWFILLHNYNLNLWLLDENLWMSFIVSLPFDHFFVIKLFCQINFLMFGFKFLFKNFLHLQVIFLKLNFLYYGISFVWIERTF